MKKICKTCQIEYDNINFCPNCGGKLYEVPKNKIDQTANKIDEKVKVFTEKTDAIMSTLSNEIKTSETVKKATDVGNKVLTTFIIILGIIGVVTLVVQLVVSVVNNERSIFSQAINTPENSELYGADFIAIVGQLTPTIILPIVAIILAGLKKPAFFVALFLVFFLLN